MSKKKPVVDQTKVEVRNFLEALADIAYIAGAKQHHTGNSRDDIDSYITWAYEFDALHRETSWEENDYLDLIIEFTHEKLKA